MNPIGVEQAHGPEQHAAVLDLTSDQEAHDVLEEHRGDLGFDARMATGQPSMRPSPVTRPRPMPGRSSKKSPGDPSGAPGAVTTRRLITVRMS